MCLGDTTVITLMHYLVQEVDPWDPTFESYVRIYQACPPAFRLIASSNAPATDRLHCKMEAFFVRQACLRHLQTPDEKACARVVQELERLPRSFLRAFPMDAFDEALRVMPVKANTMIVFDKLLELGVAPQFTTTQGELLLRHFLQRSDAMLLPVLKTLGVDLFAVDKNGYTLLHHALLQPETQGAVVQLIELGLSLDTPALDGITPLMLFVKTHDMPTQVLAPYIAQHIQPQSLLQRDREGNSVLHHAVSFDATDGDEEAVSHQLIFHQSVLMRLFEVPDVDVNAQNHEGYTPLMKAVLASNDTAVDMLIQHGADLERKDREGNTVLHLAGKEQDVDMVILLLRAGANYLQKNRDGKRVESYFINKQHVYTVILYGHRALVERHHVSLKPAEYQSFLKIAIQTYNLDIVSWLVDRVDIHARDVKGQTVLFYAINLMTPGLLERLVKAGADIEVQDMQGMTPLMHAARKGSDSMVGFLLRHGARLDIVDHEGRTFLDHLKQSKNNVQHLMIL